MCSAPQIFLFFWEYDLIFAVTGNMYVDFMGTIVHSGLKEGRMDWWDVILFFSEKARSSLQTIAFSSALSLSSAKAPWVSLKTAETGLRRIVVLYSYHMLCSLCGLVCYLCYYYWALYRGARSKISWYQVYSDCWYLLRFKYRTGHLLESATMVGRLWKLVLLEQSN